MNEISVFFPAKYDARSDMHAKDDFDPRRAAKRLLRETGTGALGTVAAGGAPYVSLVTVASDPDGSPLLLLSKLALHTENIGRDHRVSLLLSADVKAGDPLAGVRVSVSGTIAKTGNPSARRRFLARHPSARGYAEFPDFNFFRIEMERAHLVAGFGRIIDLSPDDLRTSLDGAGQLVAAEESAVSHMNEDHLDAIALYAKKLGETAGDWRLASLDPEGCDLVRGEKARRLEFPERVTTGETLRKTLVEMARALRAA
jgi:putative heme iron utilization protein